MLQTLPAHSPLEDRRFGPQVITYNAAISACEKCQGPHRVWSESRGEGMDEPEGS